MVSCCAAARHPRRSREPLVFYTRSSRSTLLFDLSNFGSAGSTPGTPAGSKQPRQGLSQAHELQTAAPVEVRHVRTGNTFALVNARPPGLSCRASYSNRPMAWGCTRSPVPDLPQALHEWQACRTPRYPGRRGGAITEAAGPRPPVCGTRELAWSRSRRHEPGDDST
jgi:hypothetical protein